MRSVARGKESSISAFEQELRTILTAYGVTELEIIRSEAGSEEDAALRLLRRFNEEHGVFFVSGTSPVALRQLDAASTSDPSPILAQIMQGMLQNWAPAHRILTGESWGLMVRFSTTGRNAPSFQKMAEGLRPRQWDWN